MRVLLWQCKKNERRKLFSYTQSLVWIPCDDDDDTDDEDDSNVM
jgi:hypothetical protein